MSKPERLSDSEDQEVTIASATYTLNPSRGINHLRQRLTYPAKGWKKKVFRDQSHEEEFDLQYGLDAETNVIPETISQSEYRTAETAYLDACFAAIGREIQRAAETTGAVQWKIPDDDYRLYQCETYWEFEHPNALKVVRELAPVLNTYQHTVLIRSHAERAKKRPSACDTKSIKNALLVTMRRGQNEEIIVYAKTATRIRFEVRHNLKKKNVLERYTATSFGGFLDLLRSIKELAALRINELLEFLEKWEGTSPAGVANSLDFTLNWFELHGRSRESEELWQTLTSRGCLTAGASLSRKQTNMVRRSTRGGLLFQARGVYYPIGCDESFTSLETQPKKLTHKGETQTVPSAAANPLFSIKSVVEGESFPLRHFFPP